MENREDGLEKIIAIQNLKENVCLEEKIDMVIGKEPVINKESDMRKTI